ncbi:MAG: phosphatidate cytidylyltransferase [Piscirickettsiaceae bacterium]|nr:phosphatidate cytidylyltransferase [Piscirickettsiaceae bacterium]
MLKQRLLTAAILIPLVVCSILLLPTLIFQWLLAGIVALAAYEWFTIIGFNTRSKMIFAMVVLVFITVVGWLLPVTVLFSFVALTWGLILLFVSRYAHQILPTKIQKILMQPLFSLLLAATVLALFLHGGIQLHQSTGLGPQQLLYILVLVWLADTGGYFAGKRWGKTPLAKSISPNKTWEGVAGAVVLGTIWTLISYGLGFSGSVGLLGWLLLSIIALIISIIGDLFESLFKRFHQIKDSGTLLPGHGGMLDRIDSLIAAVPVFTAGLFFFGAI